MHIVSDAAMAEGGSEPAEPVVSFDILPDFDLEDTEIEYDNLTEEQQDGLQNLMETLQVEDTGEINDDKNAFEDNTVTHRHVTCSNEQVDEIAGQNHKDATKWQTKWAVNVYKCTIYNFQSKF